MGDVNPAHIRAISLLLLSAVVTAVVSKSALRGGWASGLFAPESRQRLRRSYLMAVVGFIVALVLLALALVKRNAPGADTHVSQRERADRVIEARVVDVSALGESEGERWLLRSGFDSVVLQYPRPKESKVGLEREMLGRVRVGDSVHLYLDTDRIVRGDRIGVRDLDRTAQQQS